MSEEIYHKVLIDNSNGNEIGFDDMDGLLNTLHQENQQLKERRDDFITCMLGHLFVGIRKDCEDYEHWNKEGT